MRSAHDDFDTLEAITTLYEDMDSDDQYSFMVFIMNCIFLTGGVRQAYLSPCGDIEALLELIEEDDPILFAKF